MRLQKVVAVVPCATCIQKGYKSLVMPCSASPLRGVASAHHVGLTDTALFVLKSGVSFVSWVGSADSGRNGLRLAADFATRSGANLDLRTLNSSTPTKTP
jgi:hypothetical protein